jgi:hypothetical protein
MEQENDSVAPGSSGGNAARENKRAVAAAADIAATMEQENEVQRDEAEIRKRSKDDTKKAAMLASLKIISDHGAAAKMFKKKVTDEALNKQSLFEKLKSEGERATSEEFASIPVPAFDLSSKESSNASCAVAVADFFSEGNMERPTCACCNELFPRRCMNAVVPQGHWLERLTSRLSWEHTTHPLSQETRDFYDASSKVPELKNVALSPSGVVRTKSSTDGDGGEVDYEVTSHHVRSFATSCLTDISVR